MLRSAALLSILCLATLPLLPVAPADHAPSTGEGTLDGTGWIAHHVDDPQSPVHMEITLHSQGFDQDLPLHVGFAFYDENTQPRHMASATWHEQGEPTRATVDPLVDDPLTLTLTPAENAHAATFTVTATWTWTQPDPASITLMAWTAGDGSQTSWTLTAGPDATLPRATTGTDTFLRTNAATGTGIEHHGAPHPTHAHTVHETLEIQRSLIGHLTPAEPSAHLLLAHGPQETRTCPCQLHGTPPGTYAFTGTHAGPGLVLSGADATLPT